MYYVFIAFLILIGLDMVFLNIMSRHLSDQIVFVQKFSPKLKIIPGILCYLVLWIGLYYFILQPRKSPMDAAFLGWIIYSTFELTNYAIFKNWKLKTVIIDTLWGGILLGSTTYFTYLLEKIV